MPALLIFLMIFSGFLSSVLGAVLIAAGLVGPVPGGLIVMLGLIVGSIAVRWAWTGEGPTRPGDDRSTAAE